MNDRKGLVGVHWLLVHLDVYVLNRMPCMSEQSYHGTVAICCIVCYSMYVFTRQEMKTSNTTIPVSFARMIVYRVGWTCADEMSPFLLYFFLLIQVWLY